MLTSSVKVKDLKKVSKTLINRPFIARSAADKILGIFLVRLLVILKFHSYFEKKFIKPFKVHSLFLCEVI